MAVAKRSKKNFYKLLVIPKPAVKQIVGGERFVFVARKERLDCQIAVEPHGDKTLDGGSLLRGDLNPLHAALRRARVVIRAAIHGSVKQEVKVLPVGVKLLHYGRVGAADLRQQRRQQRRLLLHYSAQLRKTGIVEQRGQRAGS